MERQPDLLPNPGADSRSRRRHAPSTLVRIEAMVRVLVRVYLGVLVAVLPWLSLWTQNNLFTYSPVLMRIAESGFFRGVISGLGVLNAGLALAQLRHIRLFR